jgi:hypothetical protein
VTERFETLRFALAQADTHNKPYVQVTRNELGALVMDHDRMVEAIRAGGLTSVAEVRGGGSRAAGWVWLDEVLAAIDEYDHDWDSPGARDVRAFLAGRFGREGT